jgi:hypothetical protein
VAPHGCSKKPDWCWVLAAAAGARAIVPLIAAAANNGARYLIGVFMVVPRDRWVRRRRVRPASIVAPRQPGVVTADTNSAPRLAGASPWRLATRKCQSNRCVVGLDLGRGGAQC